MSAPRSGRILHVTSVSTTAEVFLHPHFEAELHGGWEVGLCCSDPPSGRLSDLQGLSYYQVNITRSLSPAQDLVAILKILRVIHDFGPDIVHAHTPKAGLLAMLAARISRGPIAIFHMHGLRSDTLETLGGRLVRVFERVTVLLAHETICVSESLLWRARQLRVLGPNAGHVIGAGSISGVDSEGEFNPDRAGLVDFSKPMQADELNRSSFVIGFVGRLAKDKDPAAVYHCFKEVQREIPDAVLLVVGTWDESDPVSADLRREMSLDDSVLFLGWIDRPAPAYLSMDVLVSASKREGLPVSILEAASLGVPCVAFSATGVVDAIVDGETGFIVEAGSVGAMVAEIVRYATDFELRVQHGKCARRRIQAMFRQDRVVGALLSHHEQL